MKSRVQQFDSVAVIAKEVYIDTSFIFDLLRYADCPDGPRLKSSRKFYDRMRASKVHMWTTIWAVQEVVWVILRGRILRVRNLLCLRTSTYKEFKEKYPTQYHEAFVYARPFVRRCFQAIRGFGFDIKFPTPFIYRRVSKGERILQYAQKVIDKYDLESSDAFHIAVARCEGTKHIVTNDQDFHPVKTIEVYAGQS